MKRKPAGRRHFLRLDAGKADAGLGILAFLGNVTATPKK